jgi:hypothetical protein
MNKRAKSRNKTQAPNVEVTPKQHLSECLDLASELLREVIRVYCLQRSTECPFNSSVLLPDADRRPFHPHWLHPRYETFRFSGRAYILLTQTSKNRHSNYPPRSSSYAAGCMNSSPSAMHGHTGPPISSTTAWEAGLTILLLFYTRPSMATPATNYTARLKPIAIAFY